MLLFFFTNLLDLDARSKPLFGKRNVLCCSVAENALKKLSRIRRFFATHCLTSNSRCFDWDQKQNTSVGYTVQVEKNVQVW